MLFVDSDDSLQANSLAYLVRLAEQNQLDVLRYGFEIQWYSADERRIVKKQLESPDFGVGFEAVVAGKTALSGYFIMGRFAVWLGLYRREFLEQFGLRFLEGVRYEDVPFSMEVILCAQRFMVTRQRAYHYRIRGNKTNKSITQKFYNNDIFTVYHRCLDMLFKQHAQTDNILYAILISLYYNAFVHLNYLPRKSIFDYYAALRKLALRIDAMAPQLRSFKLPPTAPFHKFNYLPEGNFFMHRLKREYYAVLRYPEPYMLIYVRARANQGYADYYAQKLENRNFARFLIDYWQAMLPKLDWERTPRLVRFLLYLILAVAGVLKSIWEIGFQIIYRRPAN